jgi:hypothetical protein
MRMLLVDFGGEKIVGWQGGGVQVAGLLGEKEDREGMSGGCRSVNHKEDGRSSGCSGGGEEGTRLWLVLLQLDGRIRERTVWLLVCSIE